jgi:hypothetical protein
MTSSLPERTPGTVDSCYLSTNIEKLTHPSTCHLSLSCVTALPVLSMPDTFSILLIPSLIQKCGFGACYGREYEDIMDQIK